MISIIICSRQASLPVELLDNVERSIGCDYELCVIDNSRVEYNIFTAYNEGVKRAKGDILCFMHEDVAFHTIGWGNLISSSFREDSKAGLYGIVGGQFIPKTPCSYWEGGCCLGEMIQGHLNKEGKYEAVKEGIPVKQPTDVVAVDGFWMCIRRALFDKIRWDTRTFNGFHCYDIDICMQVLQAGYKVQLIPNVLIEHRSPGNTDSVYLEQNNCFYKKWERFLPVCQGTQLSNLEIEQRTLMVKQMRGYLKLFIDAERQLSGIRKSRAYRLGKVILKPFRLIRCK